MDDANPAEAVILRPRDANAYARGPGTRTIPLVTASVGSTAMLNGLTDLDPGAAIPLHYHDCEESVVVIAGQAIACIDGVDHALAPGDTTWIPAGVPHFFRNPSDRAMLRILWTYGSIDATRTIVATGDTRRVDHEHRGQGGRTVPAGDGE